MMQVTIDFRFVALALLFCLAATLGVYLILALRNFNAFMRKLNDLAEKNRVYIDRTLIQLPDVTKNLNEATVSAKLSIEGLGAVAGSLDSAFGDGASAVRDGAAGIVDLIALVGSLVRSLVQIFSPGGRKK